MFNNAGEKLKIFAIISCWLGIIGSVIYGIILMGSSFFLGLLAIIVGSLLSWLGSLTPYAIGETWIQAHDTRFRVNDILRLLSRERNPEIRNR